MKLILASICTPRAKSAHPDALAADYTARAARYLPVATQTYPAEADFLASVNRSTARTPAHVILLDSRGKLLSSDDFAAYLRHQQDTGTQSIVLAIGPADGWSAAARARANFTLSFGPMTLPHQLARIVLAEQVYRALTILAGHPYHSGH